MPERASRFTATQLRADFDSVFARAHPAETPPQLELLVVRVADHHYALDLAQVAALHADRKLTEAPSPRRELLGLVGLRGLVAPVYDLRLLLGYEPALSPRWLALVDAPSPYAVAFEHFERHLRVPARDLAAPTGGQSATRGNVVTALGPLTVLDLTAISAGLTHGRRADNAPQRGEDRQ
ncbi:MAG TPA: chemotaxis protein CheW [Polyangiaceae bacterium]|nr:chemotaxis protein CheW [Polyangiaceae bacterium]